MTNLCLEFIRSLPRTLTAEGERIKFRSLSFDTNINKTCVINFQFDFLISGMNKTFEKDTPGVSSPLGCVGVCVCVFRLKFIAP